MKTSGTVSCVQNGTHFQLFGVCHCFHLQGFVSIRRFLVYYCELGTSCCCSEKSQLDLSWLSAGNAARLARNWSVTLRFAHFYTRRVSASLDRETPQLCVFGSIPTTLCFLLSSFCVRGQASSRQPAVIPPMFTCLWHHPTSAS
jgi:hypothetical protein